MDERYHFSKKNNSKKHGISTQNGTCDCCSSFLNFNHYSPFFRITSLLLLNITIKYFTEFLFVISTSLELALNFTMVTVVSKMEEAAGRTFYPFSKRGQCAAAVDRLVGHNV